MKEKLKTSFNAMHWAQTFELRKADIARLPAVSLKAHWPFLFSLQGVKYKY